MTGKYTVRFLPGEASVEVLAGTTIMAAAVRAGMFINGVCGGDGVCGRCRVIVRQGKADDGSTQFFTREEIQAGYILACEGRVASDLVIEVPAESRLHGRPVSPETQVPYLADISNLLRWKTRLSPLVRKTYLELPPPSLENNLADLQRLEQALVRKLGNVPLQTSLSALRTLPGALREANWKVTAATAHLGSAAEVVFVEPGNTAGRNFGVAADIGTTTVVCHLMDLTDGRTLGQAAMYNSQTKHGADVIRRIIHASRGQQQADELRNTIVGDLNELIAELLEEHRVLAQEVSLIVAAGNTTMVHLLLGLPAANIRKAPYIPAANELPPVRAAEVGIRIHPRGMLYCLPCVAAFVGGDVTAGILATGISHSPEIRMLLDIGTNGEIAIGNKDFLVCASASAGPAFEGAECACGMRATDGAIDHIRLSGPDTEAEFSNIGLGKPAGICGTGYVDLLAEMLRAGIIDKTGRLHPAACPTRCRQRADGEAEFVVVPAEDTVHGQDIVICQSDIQNILRAKAAIYAASAVLLHALDLTFDDVAEIMVAGAFGSFLNMANAVLIGLLPDLPPSKLRFVGNTSLAGAKLAAISTSCYEDLIRTASATTYFELSTDGRFMDEFVSASFFPHTDVERFPRVMSELQAARKVAT
jgi:uncharacterized 2Fe-2S/4Fe-4S cluster protein (DUF4445 family)